MDAPASTTPHRRSVGQDSVHAAVKAIRTRRTANRFPVLPLVVTVRPLRLVLSVVRSSARRAVEAYGRRERGAARGCG